MYQLPLQWAFGPPSPPPPYESRGWGWINTDRYSDMSMFEHVFPISHSLRFTGLEVSTDMYSYLWENMFGRRIR